MTITFAPLPFLTAAEIAEPLPLTIGLSGGSGSGKTLSALKLAAGIADQLAGTTGAPFGAIDTENRRMLHYRAEFPQMLGHYVDFGPTLPNGEMVGFPPERWIAQIKRLEENGIQAGVIDSFSHAWAGVNGVLDLQAQELDRLTKGDAGKADKLSQLAWAAIKPRYRRLTDAIIQSKINWILCTRAKPVMQDKGKNARATKTRREDVPWDVASDGELLFEMTVFAILDHLHPGNPKYQVKVADQFKTLWRADAPITSEIGRQMAEWSRGRGPAKEEKELMDLARAMARQGKDALQAWWKALDVQRRAIILVIQPELIETAKAADSAPSEELFPEAAEEKPRADLEDLQ